MQLEYETEWLAVEPSTMTKVVDHESLTISKTTIRMKTAIIKDY